jgi:hypothetical protein
MHPYTKSTKGTVKLSVFFVLLGSAHVIAACKMFVKLTPVSGTNLRLLDRISQQKCPKMKNLIFGIFQGKL